MLWVLTRWPAENSAVNPKPQGCKITLHPRAFKKHPKTQGFGFRSVSGLGVVQCVAQLLPGQRFFEEGGRGLGSGAYRLTSMGFEFHDL